MLKIGHGYDIHRFDDVSSGTEELTLGGVKIPYTRSLKAHSDGDVVIHAISDALLGALGKGDIGEHFPDTDPAYAGYDSRRFLRAIIDELTMQGYRVGNVDVTIIAESPKITPYKWQMRECLASDLHLSVDEINIKATTHEKLDAVGQAQGIAVHAVALLVKNSQSK